jgi:hypothetical protein
MVRLPAFILVGCVVCAGLILIEFGSISSHRPSPGARLPPAEIEPAAPEIRKLADPLFSPTRRHRETASSANDADSALRDVRLSGVVIGPDLRIAIFAVTGINSRVLSEGEALKGWRLESISPEGVVLSGPAGNIVLKPQPDANLVTFRQPPPFRRKAILIILQSITPGMTRIIHGAGDGLSEFPSDLADAGTASSAAALFVQASDASALPMRVLVAVSAAAVADSMIRPKC